MNLEQMQSGEREKRRFELMMEAFFKEWAPQDGFDRDRFDRELFSLVRQIYHDAQVPVLEQLGKIASHMLFPPPSVKP
jgi:hypothetical protein